MNEVDIMRNKTKIEIKREKYDKIREKLLETISQKLTLMAIDRFDYEKITHLVFGLDRNHIRIEEYENKVLIFINIDEEEIDLVEQIERIIENDGSWFLNIRSTHDIGTHEFRKDIKSITKELGKKIIQKIDKIDEYHVDYYSVHARVDIYTSTKKLTYDEYKELKEYIKFVDRKMKEIKIINRL